MRIRIFALILIICLLLLVFGLAYTQIYRHPAYKIMSEENRLKIIPLMAPRGTIFDRNGETMVKDVLSFNASIIYSRVADKDGLVRALTSVLGIPGEEIKKRVRKGRRRPYRLTLIEEDIGTEKAVNLEEIETDYPGLIVDISTKRRYMHGRAASNVIGYLGLINRAEFEKLKEYGYRIDDLVGRDGLEKQYDQYLRGRHGGKQVEVDHRGREIATLGYKEPASGKDVHLTIDLELQKYCEDLLKDKRGSIIAMDPSSGAVLAMASAPDYSPGVFIDRKRSGEVMSVLRDKKYPLMNRAIKGAYPPGSVFKVAVSTGALETGKATQNTTFTCNGAFRLGRNTFRCWKESGHGEQDMKEAIKNSCNVYFYQLGLKLGVDDMAKYAEKLGLGKPTGIDLPGESGGLLPSRKWKRKKFNEQWYRGETVNYSIGQGYLLCTPLQIARMMSVFANKGYLVNPYIVKRIGSTDIDPFARTDLGISKRSIDVVREGLWKVVNDPRGTGMKARLKDVVVAGKTGTAQTAINKTHGWFAGFAPYDEPGLTVVVFDEYGGKSGYYAAGTAGKIFDKARELGII